MTDPRHAGLVAPAVVTAPDAPSWLNGSASRYFADAAVIDARQLPAIYHTLLVHEGSMTERLEGQFGAPMGITVLVNARQGDRYARWVLMRDPVDRCIAMAGVSITLAGFDDEFRAAVLHGTQPLGRLLRRHGLTYQSVPEAFFVFTPTAWTRDLLHMREVQPIFGRRTALHIAGEKRGDIIEALPRYERQVPREHTEGEATCAQSREGSSAS